MTATRPTKDTKRSDSESRFSFPQQKSDELPCHQIHHPISISKHGLNLQVPFSTNQITSSTPPPTATTTTTMVRTNLDAKALPIVHSNKH